MKLIQFLTVLWATAVALAQSTVVQINVPDKVALNAVTVNSWQTNLSAITISDGEHWKFIPGDTTATNVAYVIASTGVAGRWIRDLYIQGAPLNIMWWGAVPGADSTAAVNAAIVNGAAMGRKVSIPDSASPFIVSTITITSNDVVLLGPGTLKKDTSNSTMMIVTGDRILVDGVRFDGNLSNIVTPTGNSSWVFGLNASHNSVVRNCFFTRSASHAIRIDNSTGCVIADNVFYDCVRDLVAGSGSGVYINGTSTEAVKDILITGNKFSFIGWRAANPPAWPFSVTVGADADGQDANGVQIQGTAIDSQTGIMIVGNLFEYCSARGVKIQSSDVTVQGNVFRYNHTSIGVIPNGDGQKNILIKGNDISYSRSACPPAGAFTIDSMWVEGNMIQTVFDVMDHQNGCTVNYMAFINNDVRDVYESISTTAPTAKLKRLYCKGNKFVDFASDPASTGSEKNAFYFVGYTDFQWVFEDNVFETTDGVAWSVFYGQYPTEPCRFARNYFNLKVSEARTAGYSDSFDWTSGSRSENLVMEDNINWIDGRQVSQNSSANYPQKPKLAVVPNLLSLAALNPNVYDTAITSNDGTSSVPNGYGQVWYTFGKTNVPIWAVGMAGSSASTVTPDYARTNAVRQTGDGTKGTSLRVTNVCTIGETYTMAFNARASATGYAFTNAYVYWTNSSWAGGITNLTTSWVAYSHTFGATNAAAAAIIVGGTQANGWWYEVKDVVIQRVSETPATNLVDCIASTTAGWVWLPVKPIFNITATAPTVPYTGQLWISNAVQTFIYSGTAWIPLNTP